METAREKRRFLCLDTEETSPHHSHGRWVAPSSDGEKGAGTWAPRRRPAEEEPPGGGRHEHLYKGRICLKGPHRILRVGSMSSVALPVLESLISFFGLLLPWLCLSPSSPLCSQCHAVISTERDSWEDLAVRRPSPWFNHQLGKPAGVRVWTPGRGQKHGGQEGSGLTPAASP